MEYLALIELEVKKLFNLNLNPNSNRGEMTEYEFEYLDIRFDSICFHLRLELIPRYMPNDRFCCMHIPYAH